MSQVAERQRLVAGPSVDVLASSSQDMARLRLDLTDPNDVVFLWWAFYTFGLEHVHVGPPCAFFSQLGRFTAKRTAEEWYALRNVALHHLRLGIRVMRWQDSQGRTGSLEQPPRCISWELAPMVALLARVGWRTYEWPSCVYGHRDLGNGRPYLKKQRFTLNFDLSLMQDRKCLCPAGGHQRVEGVVGSGPRKGARRSIVSGEYLVAMCERLVGILKDHSLGSP